MTPATSTAATLDFDLLVEELRQVGESAPPPPSVLGWTPGETSFGEALCALHGRAVTRQEAGYLAGEIRRLHCQRLLGREDALVLLHVFEVDRPIYRGYGESRRRFADFLNNREAEPPRMVDLVRVVAGYQFPSALSVEDFI